MTPKNRIQEQRMRGYFIQAAVEILRGEGMAAATVRNIAARAGYSYATLYSYFADIKDLFFLCMQEFASECKQIVAGQTEEQTTPRKIIISAMKAYAGYFVQYPGIFELFYLERMNASNSSPQAVDLICNLPVSVCQTGWTALAAETGKDAVSGLQDAVRSSVTGKLLHYLNRNNGTEYTAFSQELDTLLHNLLQPEP